MKRGAVRKSESKLLTVWTPEALIVGLERGVRQADTDKSKFVRTAIREKLARQGVFLSEEAV